jgi:hypothetical protein
MWRAQVSNDRTSMGAWMPSTQKSAGTLEQKAAKWLGRCFATPRMTDKRMDHENIRRHGG